MSKSYIAVTLDGRTLDNGGKGYVSPAAATAAAERRGTVAVETRPLGAKLPDANDAQAWDALRLRNGCPGR